MALTFSLQRLGDADLRSKASVDLAAGAVIAALGIKLIVSAASAA